MYMTGRECMTILMMSSYVHILYVIGIGITKVFGSPSTTSTAWHKEAHYRYTCRRMFYQPFWAINWC